MGTSMDIYVLRVGIRLTNTENLLIIKLKIPRETGDLEAETNEGRKEPDKGRVIYPFQMNLPNEYLANENSTSIQTQFFFNLPNDYSSSIIVTDSSFTPTDRTCAIAIAADMSFRTALAADFRREHKNIEFLWKQRP